MLCTDIPTDIKACNNNKRSLTSLYPYQPCNISDGSSRRRGKVFPYSFFLSPFVQNVVVAEDPPTSSCFSNSSSHVEEVTPTAEDYANLFFGSDDCGDDSSTVNSIQSLTMQHHLWEPEPHLSTASAAAISPARSNSKHQDQHQYLAQRRRFNKRRRVSFSGTKPTVHILSTVPIASTMTTDEKSTMWIQSSEIGTLKSSAQSTIQIMRTRVLHNPHEYKQNPHKFRQLMVTLEQETNSSVRGLEHKIYRRKETRKMLIQDVIECQQHINGLARFGHVMSEEEKSMLLANASLHKSAGCVNKALLDAMDDYKEAYQQTAG
jgi:hypothetical protein